MVGVAGSIPAVPTTYLVLRFFILTLLLRVTSHRGDFARLGDCLGDAFYRLIHFSQWAFIYRAYCFGGGDLCWAAAVLCGAACG